jgi:hypothetical protein
MYTAWLEYGRIQGHDGMRFALLLLKLAALKECFRKPGLESDGKTAAFPLRQQAWQESLNFLNP